MARYRLPPDVKAAALSYVQGYKRRRIEYKKKYNDIINRGGANYEVYIEKEKDENGKEIEVECRHYPQRVSGAVGNPTERKALELEMLSRDPDTERMRAVEMARDLIGDHIDSDEVRMALVNGIMKNCESGRVNPYEKLDLPTIGRNEFFDERRRFLYHVAKYGKLI